MKSNFFSCQSKIKSTVFLRRLTNFISKAVESENSTSLEGSIKEVRNSEATVFVDLKLKGQLISKGIFDDIVCTKKPTNFF